MLSVLELAQLLTGALDGKFNVSRKYRNCQSRKKKEKNVTEEME